MNHTGISYELAKKLKDAGFPQDKSTYVWMKPLMHDEYVLSLDLREDKRSVPDDTWKDVYAAPNLSELIEACGDEFQKLEKYGTKEKNNIKFESIGGWDEDGSYKFYTNGSTPEESSANLYISLKQ